MAAFDYGQADYIIKAAMQNAKLLADGQNPDTTQLEDGRRRLNDMILLWQSQGLKLWTNYEQSITLVVGQAAYTIGPGGNVNVAQPKRVLQGLYLDASGNRTPLNVLGREEYNRLSTITQVGAVNSYFFDKQRTLPVLNLWMVPDTTAALGTVRMTLQRPLTTIASVADIPDLPEEWRMALHWGLAAEICTGQPDSITNRCEAKALVYRQMVEDWDVEDSSTRFSPDPQFVQMEGNFR